MFLSFLVGAFVYCWVACCGETVQKLGSGHKHLGYALNKLSMGFTLPILFTPQTLFWTVWLAGWERYWPQVVTAWVGASASRPDWASCGVCLAFYWLFFCLCLGGWMSWSLWSACDDSGLQMRSRDCGAQGSSQCVGNSTQRRDCNEIPGESVSSHIVWPSRGSCKIPKTTRIFVNLYLFSCFAVLRTVWCPQL